MARLAEIGVLVALICGFMPALTNPVREKRGISKFGFLIRCATNRWAIEFSDYGCFCGYGGKGKPVDAIDRCCQIHDACYTKVMDHGCDSFRGPYTSRYDYTCTGNQTACVTDPKKNECGWMSCDCDKKAADCFAANLDSYDKSHYSLNVKKHCTD